VVCKYKVTVKTNRNEELNTSLLVENLQCPTLDHDSHAYDRFKLNFVPIVRQEKLSAIFVSIYVAEVVNLGGKQMNSLLKGSDQRDEWGVESMLKQCLYI